jgi:hypothetical protein
METNKAKIFLNTAFWGLMLWLFGYVLGFVFFAFVPITMIGWVIMPFGLAATLWVLFKKIERKEFMCFIGLGIVWTVMAIVLDYIFLVQLLKPTNYYQVDVILYYVLTFVLPIAVGWYKLKKIKA